MKLTKAKLIKFVKPSLEKLGFREFKDSKGGWQGLFCKKLENGLYLSLGLTIHRFYDSAFTSNYYLSKTTTIGAVWGDIPKEIYERPSFLLNDNERSLFQKGNINSAFSKDIWFDGNDNKSVLDFLKVVELTEPRFINQSDLIEKINKSKEVNTLFNYARAVKYIILTNKVEGKYSYIPTKKLDDIPIEWFKASEKILKESDSILNSHTVIRLAADAFRQNILDNEK